MRIVHIEFVDRAVTLIRVNVIPLVRGYRSGDAAWALTGLWTAFMGSLTYL